MSLFGPGRPRADVQEVSISIGERQKFENLMALGGYATPEQLVLHAVEAGRVILGLSDKGLKVQRGVEIENFDPLEFDAAIREGVNLSSTLESDDPINLTIPYDKLRPLMQQGEFPTAEHALEFAMQILSNLIRLERDGSSIGVMVNETFFPIVAR